MKPTKKPSGAEFKHARRERDAAERAKEATRRELLGKHPSPYGELGDPPVDDPMKGLVFAYKHLVVGLKEVAMDPVISAPERWAWLVKFGTALGLTHAKALVEHKLEQLGARFENEYRDERNAGADIEWPATSRLGSRELEKERE